MLVLDDEFVKAAEISEHELKLEIAILLFQKNKITSGKAAKLAGIHFLEFGKSFLNPGEMMRLSRNQLQLPILSSLSGLDESLFRR